MHREVTLRYLDNATDHARDAVLAEAARNYDAADYHVEAAIEAARNAGVTAPMASVDDVVAAVGARRDVVQWEVR